MLSALAQTSHCFPHFCYNKNKIMENIVGNFINGRNMKITDKSYNASPILYCAPKKICITKKNTSDVNINC